MQISDFIFRRRTDQYNALSPSCISATAKDIDKISGQTNAERGKEAPSILLPHQAAEYVSHIAIDIGGSLVKLVYFLPDENISTGLSEKPSKHTGGEHTFGYEQNIYFWFECLSLRAESPVHQLTKRH